MKDLLPKIKKWYVELTKRKMDYSPNGIRPAHNWRMLFSIFSLVILISGVIAYYFYFEINQDKLFTIEDNKSENTTVINMTLLKRVVDDVNFREANLTKIKETTSFPKDPSI
jgi:hypothetical protein